MKTESRHAEFSKATPLIFQGKKRAVCNLAHGKLEAKFVSTTIAQHVFNRARGGELSLPAFPNFRSTVSEIQKLQLDAAPTYEVCVALSDGTLIIKQVLKEMWLTKHADLFGPEAS